MRQLKLWMMSAILTCGFVTTSCDDAVSVLDNPTTQEKEPAPEFEKLGIADGELQPIDVNVALLGSFGNYADVAKFWFKNSSTKVDDQTQVVITDEITASNQADIAKVLNQYGVVLVIDPKKENVQQYAKAMGIDPNADYENLELIGLTGFGDQFLSYSSAEESSESEVTPPASIADADLIDLYPDEFMRLEAFAKWADMIEKKYVEYEKYIKAKNSSRAGTRNDDGNVSIFDLAQMSFLGVDKSIHIDENEYFKGHVYDLHPDDSDWCNFDITINYKFIPVYSHISQKDYYMVQSNVNWNLKKTVKGNKVFEHKWYQRDRRSYLFFPINLTWASTPEVTNGKYSVQVPVGGEIYPSEIKHNKSIHKERNIGIEGGVSAGVSDEGASADANLGFSASWNRSEDYEVEETNLATNVAGSSVGHVMSIPGTEDGYRPKMVNSALDKGFEVPCGVNFRKTLSTNEDWVWVVSGTSADTNDESIRVKFTAEPEVCWYSYIYTGADLREKYCKTSFTRYINVPAPNRMDAGFLKITADTEGYQIFGVKATEVSSKKVVFNKDNVTTKNGEVFNLGLPANKSYDIELQMGSNINSKKTYILENRNVDGHGAVQNLNTSAYFKVK